MARLRSFAPLGLIALAVGASAAPTLTTRWTSKVSPSLPHPEYPRPQMVRGNWVNLNGPWDFAVVPEGNVIGSAWRKILVPFPVESKLSGVQQSVPDGSKMVYQRTFTPPAGKGRVLLHFGAVDYSCSVSINGKVVGQHEGGYVPFTFDITDYLKGSGPQRLTVLAVDHSDGPFWQPRGKQVRKPGGIFYTPTSGIWQTVWAERVPAQHVESLYCETALDGTVKVHVKLTGTNPSAMFEVVAKDQGRMVARAIGGDGIARLKIAKPKLWEPGSPHLYGLEVSLKGPNADHVKSYFGIREVRVGKAKDGKTRILVNGKPLFLVGPLDQGFWPDGLYTAPTDGAMKFDLDFTKRLGFNMVRKHVKVEPDRWYTFCDQMGLVVIQDMPSADHPQDATQAGIASKRYEGELKAMIDARRAHPSIATWVVFNEGWGQYDTERITKWTKAYDPTRMVDNASGWVDKGVGDFKDDHIYPGPGSSKPEAHRAAVLGEFGGLGLITPGHMWQKGGWGYVSYKSKAELTDALVSLFHKLHYLIGKPGLSAAVYTQTTDVESESNGLLTYDREVVKFDEAKVSASIRALFGPVPAAQLILPTSVSSPATWKYTTQAPKANWFSTGFKDATWSSGLAGFGAGNPPKTKIRTNWNTPDIWLRREINLPKPIRNSGLNLSMYHDEDVEVYIDGILVSKAQGYTTDYTLEEISPRVLPKLTAGKHLIAAHVHQTTGGQFFDLGIVNLIPARP